MQKKIDQRIVKTHDSLQQAFSNLIVKEDFNSINITDLTRKANVDRKTFYLHYSKIGDIPKEFEDNLLKEIKKYVTVNNIVDLSKFLVYLNDLIQQNPNFYHALFDINNNSFLLIRCKDILKDELIQRYSVSEHLTHADFEIFTEFIAAGTMSIYLNWFNGDLDIPFSALINTLTAKKGQKLILDLDNMIIKQKNDNF